MSIKQSASSYLEDAPADWLRFANNVAGRLARHMVEDLPSFEIGPVRRSLSDSLLAVLLLPANVQVVAKADTDSQAAENIVECVKEVLDEIDVEVPESDGETDDDEIVDLGSSGQLVRRWDGYRYDDSRRLLSVRSALRPTLSDDRLLAIVNVVRQRALARHDSETRVDDGGAKSLVRLDLIDLALYRALTAHPELLKTLDWRTFERLLADILETFGYVVELQRGTKDGGVDIFALRSDHFGQHRYMIQAKRWTNRVGVEPVRQLLFLQGHHHATKSCLATTSAFTEGAWDLAAQYRWQLELRDFDGIREWVTNAGRLKTGGT